MTKTAHLYARRHWYLAIYLSLALVISGLLAQRAFAQDARTISISPPSVEHSMDPGGRAEGKIRLINDSTEPLTFTVTVQDFIVEDQNGTPSIMPVDDYSSKYSASNWIAVFPTSVTIPPTSREEFSYYIQVPADATAGGHYAAVVFSPTSEGEIQGSGATVQTKVSTLVSIGVSGTIKEGAQVTQFAVDGFHEYGPVTLNTLIKNDGDLHIRPKGSVTVTDSFGRLVSTQQLQESNIFPGVARAYANEFGKKFMIGRYTAKLDATYGRNGDLKLMATTTFWVLPWKVMTVALLSIVVVVLLVILERRKLAKHHSEPQS